MGWGDWTRTTEIEPSLYAADFLRLGEQIQTLLNAGARIFHVDVGDGRFVPPVTIGPIVVRAIAPLIHEAGGRLDCHLMVADPASQVRLIAAAGGDSVTFHIEAVDDPSTIIAQAREHGLDVGVACNPDTPVGALAEAATRADLALCMSVHPGFSGQELIPESIERVRRLRELLPESVLVQVDGGVNHGNVRELHEAGAELLVAGSAIFGMEDIPRAYRRLVRSLA